MENENKGPVIKDEDLSGVHPEIKEEYNIPLSEDFSVDMSKYPNLKKPEMKLQGEQPEEEEIVVTKEDFKVKRDFNIKNKWILIVSIILGVALIGTIFYFVVTAQPKVAGLWVSEDGKVLFFTKDTMLNIDLRHNEMTSEHYEVKGNTLYITHSEDNVTEHPFKIKKDILTIDKELMIYPEYTRQEDKRDILLQLISVDAQVESYGRDLEITTLKLKVAENTEDTDYDVEYLKSYQEYLQMNIDNLEQERDKLLISLNLLSEKK